MSAISFLAGMGAGAVRSERVERELKMRESDEARRQALFDAQMAEAQRVTADREAVRRAAAPVPIEETPIAGPVMPGEAPLPNAPTVGGRQFAERGAAQEAAAEANSPQAVNARVIATMRGQGNVIGAEQVRNAITSADAAEAQLKKFTQDAIKEGTMDFLGKAMAGASPDELLATYNAIGKKKLRDVTVEPFEVDHPALGKQRSARIKGTLEDGTVVDIPDAFQSSFALFGAAKRFDLLKDFAREKRQSEKDDRQLDIQQQQADTQERYRRDQAENMRQQRALEGQRIAALEKKSAGPGEPIQVSVKDMRDFQGDVQEQIKDQFPIKEGADAAERAKMAAAASAAKARAVSIFTDNAKIGNPLVAATALQAITLAADPKNEKIVDINGRKFGAVIVNGQPVIVTGELQAKPPAAAAPTAAAPTAPAMPQPAAAALRPASPAAMAAAAPAGPQFPPQHVAAMEPLNAAVAQASAALAMAAKSGDQRAIAMYGQQVQAARAARLQEAVRRLGQAGAQAYLSSLPQ